MEHTKPLVNVIVPSAFLSPWLRLPLFILHICKQPHSLMKHLFILFLLIPLFCLSQDTGRPFYSIGVHNEIPIVISDKNEKDLNYAIGLSGNALINLSERYKLRIGLGLNRFFIRNYINTSAYTSDWTNGPYESKVKKTADIDQTSIQVPVSFSLSKKKFEIGVGVSFDYLIQSKTTQSVQGKYNNPAYPNSETVLSRTIQAYYNISSDHSLNNYRRTNISPKMSLGYWVFKNVFLSYSLSYTLYSNPIFYHRMNDYHLLTNSIGLHFNLKTYEN
jgi:hypothetical protein